MVASPGNTLVSTGMPSHQPRRAKLPTITAATLAAREKKMQFRMSRDSVDSPFRMDSRVKNVCPCGSRLNSAPKRLSRDRGRLKASPHFCATSLKRARTARTDLQKTSFAIEAYQEFTPTFLAYLRIALVQGTRFPFREKLVHANNIKMPKGGKVALHWIEMPHVRERELNYIAM